MMIGGVPFESTACRCVHSFNLGVRRYVIDGNAMTAFPADRAPAGLTAQIESAARCDASTCQCLRPLANETVSSSLTAIRSVADKTPNGLVAIRPLSGGIPNGLIELGLRPAGGSEIPDDDQLRTLTLMVNQTCNLACTYCYADGGEYGSPGQMTAATAKRAVDWLIERSGPVRNLVLTFFGGEPLISFGLIKDVVAYANRQGDFSGKVFSFSTTTNGTLLSDEIIAFLKEHQFEVMVSLDGSKGVNDDQRPFKNGKGSYDTIVPKLRKLLAEMPETPARATITGAAPPDEIRQALHEIGFRKTGLGMASGTLFESMAHEPRSVRSQGVVALLAQDTEDLLETIRQRDAERLKTLDSAILGQLAQFLAGNKSKHPCGAGRRLVAVSAQGDVSLCHRFVGTDDYTLGTIFEDNVTLPALNVSPVEHLQPCSTCFAKYLCGGACYHDNVTTNGSLYEPAPDLCNMMRRTMELVAYLSCELTSEDRAFLASVTGVGGRECWHDYF